MSIHTRRTLLVLLLLALFAVWALAAVAQPAPAQPLPLTTITPVYGDEDAQPLAMLTVYDPWAAVLGADSPVFVLYETGQVLYTRINDDNAAEYWSVMLDEDERDALVDALDIEAFWSLDDYYDLAMITDQPSQVFTVAGELDDPTTVGVYGSLRRTEVRNAAPEVLVNAYDLMVTYVHPDAEPWLPPMFEVIVWPWDTSDAADWPADFPQLDSPFAVQREMVTSIYVDIAAYERFAVLAEDARALRLDGETYAFSVRWPFPHEVVWPTASRPTATATARPA